MKNIFSILLIVVILSACKDKNKVEQPLNPNEEEVITTVKLVAISHSNNMSEATFKGDPDGSGPLSATVDTLKLLPNNHYDISLLLLNEFKTPADTISEEVYNERNQHQVFYPKENLNNISFSYADFDDNGVPLGLETMAMTGPAEQGKLRIVLKHQPGIKPKSGSGDINLGASDVDVTFPVKVE